MSFEEPTNPRSCEIVNNQIHLSYRCMKNGPQFSSNNVCAIMSKILPNIKCPQLSKPKGNSGKEPKLCWSQKHLKCTLRAPAGYAMSHFILGWIIPSRKCITDKSNHCENLKYIGPKVFCLQINISLGICHDLFFLSSSWCTDQM